MHEIEAQSGASVHLDRTRGVLHAVGSRGAIHSVRLQVACLQGSRRSVAPPVWAELMRTRTSTDSASSCVARIQGQSGCRLHIERSCREVRVFGTSEASAMAHALLDELHDNCIEEVVSFNTPVGADTLQDVADRCAVTLLVDGGKISALGGKPAVAQAVVEFQKRAKEEASASRERPTQKSSWADVSAAEDSQGDRAMRLPPLADLASSRDGGSVSGSCSGSRNGSHAASASASMPGRGHGHVAGQVSCPTCGSGHFCVSCGHELWRPHAGHQDFDPAARKGGCGSHGGCACGGHLGPAAEYDYGASGCSGLTGLGVGGVSGEGGAQQGGMAYGMPQHHDGDSKLEDGQKLPEGMAMVPYMMGGNQMMQMVAVPFGYYASPSQGALSGPSLGA